jgi:hypothetical protein
VNVASDRCSACARRDAARLRDRTRAGKLRQQLLAPPAQRFCFGFKPVEFLKRIRIGCHGCLRPEVIGVPV